MKDNTSEEGDPPPDACPALEWGGPPKDLASLYQPSSEASVEYDPDREYSTSFVLPNEDIDPEPWKEAMDAYREGAIKVSIGQVKDRGWYI